MIYTTDRYNITVDIDDRRTGKTTRMVQDIVNHIQNEPNNIAYLFCINRSMFIQIQERCIEYMITHYINLNNYPLYLIERKMHDLVCDMIKTCSIRDINRIVYINGVKLFFDEYDLIVQQENNADVYTNAYYNGTPINDNSPIIELYNSISTSFQAFDFRIEKHEKQFKNKDDEYLYRIGVQNGRYC